MGKNDLEKLLLRVLNETQYKKVRSYLDQAPQHFDPSGASSNFVITGTQQTKADS